MSGIAAVFLAAVLVMIGPTRTRAQSFGTDLAYDCEILLKAATPGSASGTFSVAAGHSQAAVCYGFVSAIQQLSALEIEPAHTITYTCLPPNSSIMQLVQAIVDYGHRHPDQLKQTAGSFTLNALREVFPCGRPH